MTKRLFFTFAFVLLLSITNLDCFAQTYDPLNPYIPPTLKAFLSLRRDYFKRMTLSYFQRGTNGKYTVYLQSEVEYPAIPKGDTTRVRYVFDNNIITHIEIEGVGKTTPKDIERGFFDVTVCPEQTTLYKTNIHVKSAKDSIVVLEGVANRRVVVIDGDRSEYANVIRNFCYARRRDKLSGAFRYLNSLAGDVPEGLWVYSPEKLNERLGIIAGKNNVLSDTIPDTKTILQMETAVFDSLKWNPKITNVFNACEHNVIARGDSTRIKILFNNRRVRSIKVLGYGKASKEDIKKGEYVVTVAPKKTKLIECYVNGGERAHRRVIVIDPEKYDEVMRKLYELRIVGGYLQYLDKLAGSVPLF